MYSTTSDYLWLVIIGGFFSFIMGFGIGANDVANAFSTSIGSKAVSIKKAIVIAAIFEFSGAVLLGSTVAQTIRKGIIDVEQFKGEEDILMLGMACSLLSGAFWLILATKYSLPVSTTHTIIGSILGFGLVSKGVDAIDWSTVGFVFVSFVVAPILCAVSGIVFFFLLRFFILYKKNSYERSLKLWFVFVFLVFFIMSFFIMLKSKNKIKFFKESHFVVLLAICLAIGIFCSVVLHIIFIVLKLKSTENLKTKSGFKFDASAIETDDNKKNVELEAISPESQIQLTTTNNDIENEQDNDSKIQKLSLVEHYVESKLQEEDESSKISANELQPLKNTQTDRVPDNSVVSMFTKGVNVDIHKDMSEGEQNIHDLSEKFDVRVEHTFAWLQVLTAGADCFGHGSNDCANSVAPFATILALYKQPLYDSDGQLHKSEVPIWILALGGFAMSFGLATYGYKIIKVLGVRMAAMSCTRGYCIELSSATVVILSSYLGIPSSTTQCQVGATVGVGLTELFKCNKNREKSKLSLGQVVNWVLLLKTFFGWILTIVVSATFSAILFALLAYSPSARK